MGQKSGILSHCPWTCPVGLVDALRLHAHLVPSSKSRNCLHTQRSVPSPREEGERAYNSFFQQGRVTLGSRNGWSVDCPRARGPLRAKPALICGPLGGSPPCPPLVARLALLFSAFY